MYLCVKEKFLHMYMYPNIYFCLHERVRSWTLTLSQINPVYNFTPWNSEIYFRITAQEVSFIQVFVICTVKYRLRSPSNQASESLPRNMIWR
jgi:hypothetical protein